MSPNDEPLRAAIVGAGVSGFIAYIFLRYLGIPANQIAMFDDSGFSLDSWTRNTGAIDQVSMRSESEGHFFATDYPGFALLESVHRVSPLPLLRSVFNRYNPKLGDVLAHARALDHHYDIREQVIPIRVQSVHRIAGPQTHFVLRDALGNEVGKAAHVLLALGHGRARWPAACDDERRLVLDGRLFHSYQPKPYGANRVMVIGSGLAGMTEWINVLRHQGRVVSVRRRSTVAELPLSAPRCSFAGPWLDAFHHLDPDGRGNVLGELSHGTLPRDRTWKRMLREASRSGQFEVHTAEVEALERTGTGVSVAIREIETRVPSRIEVDHVVCATGFSSGWQEHTILREIVTAHGAQTFGDHLILEDDCTVPGLSLPGSVLSLSGPMAAWAFPAADSFAAMKYSARRFGEHVLGTYPFGLTRVRSWMDMVRGGWPYGSSAAAPSETEPCVTR